MYNTFVILFVYSQFHFFFVFVSVIVTMKSFPCISCKQSVKSNQKALLCTACNEWIHISCAGVPPKVYHDDTEQFVNWQCRKCIFSLLPFYNSENKEYKSSELINNASVKNKPNIINKPPK